MSDTSQGPGWWIASDGKWYAPEHAMQPVSASDTSAPPVGQAQAAAPGGLTAPPGPGYYQATDGYWYPQQSGMAPERRKKPVYKRVWFWLLIIVAAFVVLIIAILAAAGTAINAANTKVHTVVYTVSGTGTADVDFDSFDNGHSGSSQLSNVSLPWTQTIKGSGLFNYYSVTATVGAGGGSATCTLTVDGKQVSTNTANGALATASCNGNAP